MDGIQITSSSKRVFQGGEIDFKINAFNKRRILNYFLKVEDLTTYQKLMLI